MRNKFKKILNPTFFIILSLMIIGFFLRTYYLDKQNILFGYDQARDAYVASQISHGDLKILGPPVSIGGFYHGVLYYYFISFPYLFSNGNPALVIIFLSLLNILAIPVIFLIGKKFFSQKIGILSAIFYTVSFDIIQYSNWLSNPSLAVPFSVILYLGLMFFFLTPKKNLGLLLTAIGYGLCFQSQFFLGFLIIPIVFSFFYFKEKITFKQILLFIFVTTLVTSTMILSYFKFGFTFIEGLKTMFSNQDPFSYKAIDFSIDLKMVLLRLFENFYRTVFPFKIFFTSIFVVFCFVFFLQKNKKINKAQTLMWIFIISQSLIIPFGGISTPYINVGLQIPAIFITSVFLVDLYKNKKNISIFLICLFLFFSIQKDLSLNPKGVSLFAIQKELTLKNETELINYTYQASQNQPFSINTITSPYWVNTLWSYLYQWFGQKNYGYTPSFHGRDQSYQNSYLSQVIDPKTEYFYLIIEPNNGIPQYLIDDTIAYEDSFSQVVETKNFNGILVQKRQLNQPLEKINFVK